MRNANYRAIVIVAIIGLCFWPGALVGQVSAKILTVIVDPGHGGQDHGGKAPSGVLEKDITLALARKLVEALENSDGFRPVLTRKDDYAMSLDDRAGLANHRRGDLLISLHLGNSFRPAALGFSVYFWSPTRVATNISPSSSHRIPWDQAQSSFWEESRLLAGLIEEEFLKILSWPSGGVLQADLYLLRRVRMPAVLVEIGSLSHPGEASEVEKPTFQKVVAQALADAIKEYARMAEEEGSPAELGPKQ